MLQTMMIKPINSYLAFFHFSSFYDNVIAIRHLSLLKFTSLTKTRITKRDIVNNRNRLLAVLHKQADIGYLLKKEIKKTESIPS